MVWIMEKFQADTVIFMVRNTYLYFKGESEFDPLITYQSIHIS